MLRAARSRTEGPLIRLPSTRPRIVAVVAITVLLTACTGDDDGATTRTGEETDNRVTLQVVAVDNSFSPASLSAPAGGEVTVEVSNDGSNPHTFTIDDLDVDTSTIDAGNSETATFTMPESSVSFYCVIHGEKAMSGEIDAT